LLQHLCFSLTRGKHRFQSTVNPSDTSALSNYFYTAKRSRGTCSAEYRVSGKIPPVRVQSVRGYENVCLCLRTDIFPVDLTTILAKSSEPTSSWIQELDHITIPCEIATPALDSKSHTACRYRTRFLGTNRPPTRLSTKFICGKEPADQQSHIQNLI
jgi:hypothetical protein